MRGAGGRVGKIDPTSLFPRVSQTRHSFVLDLVRDANTECARLGFSLETLTPVSCILTPHSRALDKCGQAFVR